MSPKYLRPATSVILMSSMLMPFLVHATAVSDAVTSLQQTTPGLPTGVSNPKGTIWLILSTIFQSGGEKIKAQYLDLSGITNLWTTNGSSLVYNGWNVGIGTTTPTAKLEVNGDIKAGDIYGGVYGGTRAIWKFDNTNPNYGIFYTEGTIDKMSFSAAGGGTSNPDFVINGSNVGIVAGNNPVNRLQIGQNPNGWTGNDLVVSNANGGVAINNNVGSSYIFGSQKLNIYAEGTNTMTLIGGRVGIGTATPSTTLDVAGDIKANAIYNNEIYNNGWYRSNGNTGWYSQTYGGGWYMSDSEWIRSYGAKKVYIDSSLRTDGELQVGWNGARFNVTAGGNVGIGTTTPTGKLTTYNVYTGPVGAVSGATLSLASDGSANSDSTIAFGKQVAGAYSPAYMRFVTNDPTSYTKGYLAFGTRSVTSDTAPTEALRIDTTGNVGIGISTPAEKLDLNGNIRVTGAILGQGGKSISNTPWFEYWSSIPTGSYILLSTPIVANEGNMFRIHIKGYEYSTPKGDPMDIICTGYAYNVGTLMNHSCFANGTSLPIDIGHEVRADQGNKDVVVIRIGNTTGPAFYFPQVTFDYNGWNEKRADDFKWTTSNTPPTSNFNQSYISDRWQNSYIGQSAGNLGVGTNAPTHKLTVSGTRQDPGAYGNGIMSILGDDVSTEIGASPNGTYAGWIQTKRISDNLWFPLALQPQGGNVGIGTVNPGYKLDVSGSGRFTGNLTVDGTINGVLTSSLNAANVSAGAFGANTGGGNYTFPASVTANGYISDTSGKLARNLLDVSSWTISSGDMGKFSQNGSSSENVRAWGVDPTGKQSILWSSPNDTIADADGGWNYFGIPVDNNKSYRSLVWVKRSGSASSGQIYLGADYSNTLNLDGSPNTNPYFVSLPASNLSVDKWYLIVGYIHAKNDSSTTNYSAIYDVTTGEKILNGTDYKNAGNTNYQAQRTYNYYDTAVGDVQYFWGPRFEEVNGNEPTIESLLGSASWSRVTGKPTTLSGYGITDSIASWANSIGDWQLANNANGTTSYSAASLELRESNFGGASNTSPRLAFHWGWVVASQIGIESSGRIAILNNPGSGYEDLIAKNITANSFIGNATSATTAVNATNAVNATTASTLVWGATINEVSNSGWYRSNGNTGWYSQTYGGGLWMNDSNWLRIFGGKGFWGETGIIGTNGSLSIGYGWAAGPGGWAIIAWNTGIWTSTPSEKLEVVGNIKANSFIGNATSATTAVNATNAVNATTAVNATNATNAVNASNVPWSGVSGKPTTVAGYGITDIPKWYDGWVTSPGYDANTIWASKSGFTYANNAPHAGPLVRFDAGNYDLEFNAEYGGGWESISFRTKNGDNGNWNAWNNITTKDNIAPHVSGITISELFNNGWYRSNGNTGWYSQTYGGGIWMSDSNWVRIYGGKGFWAEGGTIGTNGSLSVGYGWAVGPGGGAIFSGPVWIGTSTPSGNMLDVRGHTSIGASAKVRFEDQGTFMRAAFNELRFYDWDWGGDMLTLNNGRVGIGTTAPSEALEVNGNVKATAYYYSSDKRLKENIAWLSNSLEKISQLNGYTYTWKKDGRKDMGVIAQEVEKIYPDMVHTDATTGMKSVEYGNLVAPLIESVKELKALNDAQQKQIDEQNKKIDLLIKVLSAKK